VRRGIALPPGVVRTAVAAWVVSGAGWAAAQPTPPPEPSVAAQIAALRADLQRLQSDHQARLAALEARIAALEGQAAGPPRPEAAPAAAEAAPAAPPEPGPTAPPAPVAAAAVPGGTADVPTGAAGAGGPTGPLPVYGVPTSKVFNPDIAVIGNFVGAMGENEIDPRPSLQLDEAEASFQAVVDPYARADFFLSFGPEGVDVEEGFLTFPTLPGGLLMKVGKMKAAFGKVNTMHVHVLPWVDVPLVQTNLLGGEEGFADSGISVSRLVPVPGIFLEATGEIFRGESENLFAAPTRSDVAWAGRLRAYHDLAESSNLELGGSFLQGHNGVGPETTTRLFGVDATFRWRPLRRAIYRRFLARTELMWSRREQDPSAADAFGFYVSGEYQFARRWFAGVRLDQSDRATDPSLQDRGGSLLLTYWPSEFSQVRGQYRRTKYGEGFTANELLFQFLFSIGAHGAHAF
jgi:hypothetical protein